MAVWANYPTEALDFGSDDDGLGRDDEPSGLLLISLLRCISRPMTEVENVHLRLEESSIIAIDATPAESVS